MPLPSDEELLKTAQALLTRFPAHGKGILLEGTFIPTPEASLLSNASHFNVPATPILVRFSNSTGLPTIPDNDLNADPRGMAIRFNLPPTSDNKRVHTDIICHSTPFFPTRTGAGFLEFLQKLVEGKIGEFLAKTPSAKAFVEAPKPAPSSFAREEYFGVSAFKLVGATGKATFIRYRIVPVLGVETLDESALKEKDQSYLLDDIKKRLGEGDVNFKLIAQIADDGDIIDDSTQHWPETRQIAELGTVKIEKVSTDNAKKQKSIIFDPIPRIQGVEPSDDPMLEMRAAIYLISGRERRSA
ncbi:catalase related subgroup [Phlyctema vagabunda]|uniref:Catalase related subgroup n=1 Tax=Phlyctema vagabunda TaxID=108571 RepID=A0ABR4P891_9HELO